MTALRRDPAGKFIDSASALYHWLPVLMSRARQSELFRVTLRRMAEFCVWHASEEYRQAGTRYTEAWNGAESLADATAHYGEVCHKRAGRWLRKRDVLLKALVDIEAIDREP